MFWRLTDPLFFDVYLATEIYFILNLMQKKKKKYKNQAKSRYMSQHKMIQVLD